MPLCQVSVTCCKSPPIPGQSLLVFPPHCCHGASWACGPRVWASPPLLNWLFSGTCVVQLKSIRRCLGERTVKIPEIAARGTFQMLICVARSQCGVFQLAPVVGVQTISGGPSILDRSSQSHCLPHQGSFWGELSKDPPLFAFFLW